MLGPFDFAHAKDYVLQTCSLCCGPVNTIDDHIRWNTGCIQNQVPDLSVESVGRLETQLSCRIGCVARLILIAIDKGESCEVGCSFDDREAVRVPNDLGVVVVDDRRRRPVYTGRDVYYGWTSGRRLARSRPTTSSTTDS